jgi:MYXO-CTERM domain-containing protein
MTEAPVRPPWRECLVVAALVAGVTLAVAFSLHDDCIHGPPPVDRPDPGTPRASFCGTTDTGQPWGIALLFAALVIIAGAATRRRSVIVVWFSVVLAVIAVVMARLAPGLRAVSPL